ncbi:MAG: hypothetical protein JW754_02545, partial [Candidatus Aenigmarchaeota archaeon]|nr:hypothetical protein [Candidatus Aenigmarchaeota archaeon]
MMKVWDETSEQVLKIKPDKEKALSLLDLINLRERNLKLMNSEEFTTLIVEGYYEIIKEMITGIMSIDVWKTLSHEMLIGYIAKFYSEFPDSDISIMDQLRKTRNDISYRGVTINNDYIERNRDSILTIIEKLRKILNNKL